jgi:peptide-methionine (R)-S-oxide reductase
MPDRRDVLRGGISAGALLLATGLAGADPKGGTFEITRTEAEWRTLLTPEQFHILRQHGTERAFSHPLDREYRPGTYSCAGCQLPLFSSTTKYNSGTGWPSFYAPMENAVATRIDRGFFMTRTEVHCRRCGGHLGHVFDDGPRPTGLRYCMNGTALIFTPEAGPEPRGPGKS